MNLISIGYAPPPRLNLHPEAFLASLGKFKHTRPLVLFSEHPWPERTVEARDPEAMAKLLKSPHGPTQALNNLLWLSAIKLAIKRDATHFLYLESDCRVGRDGWDEAIFTEFFSSPRPLIAGGTLAVFNPLHPLIRARWEKLSAANTRKNFPVAGYGMEAGEKSTPGVFPIGALGVYETEWMARLFDVTGTSQDAARMAAWDHELGFRLWREFGPMAFDVTGHLSSVYSGYHKDGITTEPERLEMLRSGQVVAVHPVKSEAVL